MTRTIHFSAETIARFTKPAPVIRVRFAEEHRIVSLASLDVTTITPDEQIRRAVATHLIILPEQLRGHAIERLASGNLTLLPAENAG